MKNKLFTLMLILSSSLFLVNCAKNNSGGSTPTAVATAGTCSTAGYVYTQYGCMPQSTCPTNYGYYNGSCYPATTTTPSTCGVSGYVQTAVGCVPQGTCPVNYGYYNGQCYPVTTTSTVTSCSSTDVVNTQLGALTVGVCQPYCAQYGKKYGYSNGYCYPAL